MGKTLYLDECTSVLLPERLQQRDPQGTLFATIEHATTNARGLSDPGQPLCAVERRATVITHNIRDFSWLHRWWKTLQEWGLLTQPHAGILVVPNNLRLDAVAGAIVTFFSTIPVPALENNMYVFKQSRWVKERW